MWLVRNKDNSLRLFHNKPYRSTNEWKSKYNEPEFYLPEDYFPLLKWEDEPLEVELTLTPSSSWRYYGGEDSFMGK